MSQKTRRIIERFVVPSILTAALIAVSFYGISKNSQANGYKQTTEAMYRRAFSQLCDDFSEMEVHLSKLKAASQSSRCIILLDDIWRLSGSSVSLMSQIPASHVDTNELNSFVVRIGDYAHALTKKLLNNESLTEDDSKQIGSLQKKCAEISKELNSRLSKGDIPTASLNNDGFFTASEQNENGYKNSEGIDEFPTLIYDGPFSESTEKAEAKGLSGGDINENDAINNAKDILKTKASPTSSVFSNGKIPTFDLTFEDENGTVTDISITKTGGMLLWMMKSGSDKITASASTSPNGDEGELKVDEETTKKLTEAALNELDRLNFKNMHPTYAQYYNNTAVINFAAMQDDVILYNDLVKVWVNLSTFKVTGLDARNYFFSHKERELKSPTLSMEEAEKKLSPSLEVKEKNIALIPLTPSTEVLCYEFKATVDNEEYIVYINVETGNEEEIFKIINTESGQLVI